MGCDIHAHVEIKLNGKWQHYSCPPIQRWYLLFEKICGVRGNVTNAITPPRGLPDDITEVTKYCYENEDAHTATWLTAKELDELINWADSLSDDSFQLKEFGYLNGNMFSRTNPEITDCRFICWFDN